MIADRPSHGVDDQLLMRLSAPKTGDLGRVRGFVREAAASLGVEPLIVEDLVQAVDESVTNVIVHGYDGQPGPIEISVERVTVDATADQLVVRILDEAPCFDPNGYAPADLTTPLTERPLHGMGIHLTRSCVDRIDHQATDGIDHPSDERRGNELTLAKYLERRRAHAP